MKSVLTITLANPFRNGSIPLLTILFFTSCYTKTTNERELAISDTLDKFGTPYDTVNLKNNFQLIYSTTADKRNLRLLGQSIDTLIWSNEINELEKFMGWLEADFNDHFVLYSSAGNGAYEMRLFSKKNGKELERGTGIKNALADNKIFYQDNDLSADNLTLLDLETMKKETFTPPDEIHCIQWWHCIDTIDFTEHELTLTYFDSPESFKIKKYAR